MICKPDLIQTDSSRRGDVLLRLAGRVMAERRVDVVIPHGLPSTVHRRPSTVLARDGFHHRSPCNNLVIPYRHGKSEDGAAITKRKTVDGGPLTVDPHDRALRYQAIVAAGAPPGYKLQCGSSFLRYYYLLDALV